MTRRYAADIVWQFRTARFLVTLELEHMDGYEYDGDDENGETQAALDSGELIAFDSKVTVYLDGNEVGADYLGSSVYGADNFREFYTAHRDSDPNNRNTLAMKASGRVICHYFPDMVRSAIADARKALCNTPRTRCAA